MFGSSRVSDSEGILKVVSEFDLLRHYFGITTLPCSIPAPYREDHKASVSLTFRSNRIRFKDFGGLGEDGDIFDLLGKIWGTKYQDTLDRVYKELPLITKQEKVEFREVEHRDAPVQPSEPSDLQCRVRDWKKHDFEYWESYGIERGALEYFNVHPVSTIIITKNGNTYKIPADKYAYVYVEFKDNVASLKLYQPFNDIFKWTSKHSASVWDLWNQLPETGDTVVITSSRKDAMCIWCNTFVPATSLQGEGYMPKAHVVEQLKRRFKNVYVLFDNDFDKEMNYGRMYGKKFSETYDVKQVEIPTMYKSKDPSDLYKNHGKELMTEVICDLLSVPNPLKGEKESESINAEDDSAPF